MPDIVVLLTDGANTRGVDPVDGGAAGRRPAGARLHHRLRHDERRPRWSARREQLGADVFSEGGFPGGGGPGGGGLGAASSCCIDEPTLRAVADLTGGTFYRAEDADQLRDVFASLPERDRAADRRTARSRVAFAIVGALLALGAVGLSLLWNRSP